MLRSPAVQTPTNARSAKGGGAAAEQSRRDGAGRFNVGKASKTPEVKMRLMDPRKERTADHFDPKPIHARLALQRPWPRISGSEDRLKYTIGHLRRVAAAAGISIKVLPEGRGEAGQYDSNTSMIHLASEVLEDPALYAWVIAHELGHALDPRFAMLGGVEYKEPKYHGEYEAVADTIARHSLESFGLIIDDHEPYLDRVYPPWRRRINSRLRDRIYVASSPLCKPLPDGHPQIKRRAAARKRALRRARAEVREEMKRNKPPPKLPGFIRR